MKRLPYLLLLISQIVIPSLLMSQTVVKNIPLITEDAYVIKIWGYHDEINQWVWASADSSASADVRAWKYENRINVKVDRYDEFDVLLIRGFGDCKDTTFVKIYGSYYREVVKDKPDFRKTIPVDGGSYTLGTKIERPKL